MVQAENLAVDPVHLKGGRNRHHRGTGPPEYLKQIADRHIGAIDHAEIFPPYPQITGKRLKEAFRLRIRGENSGVSSSLTRSTNSAGSPSDFHSYQPQIRKAPLAPPIRRISFTHSFTYILFLRLHAFFKLKPVGIMGFSLFLRRHRHIIPVLTLHDRFDIVGKGKLTSSNGSSASETSWSCPPRSRRGWCPEETPSASSFSSHISCRPPRSGRGKAPGGYGGTDGFMHQAADRPNGPGQ